MTNQPGTATPLRCGCITLIGLPNAGKSSLLNKLVGETLAIVTAKAQTTWKSLRGFVTRPDLELVVTDTPGLQDGSRALNAAMAANASQAVSRARKGRELVAWVWDAADVGRRLRDKKPLGLDRIEAVLASGCGELPFSLPLIPTFTKSDLVRRPEHRAEIEKEILPFLNRISSNVQPVRWLSVASGEGIDEWLGAVGALLPEGETGSLFDTDSLSDQNLREFAAEYIREQCFLQLGEELPYSIAVQIEKYDETDPKVVRIEATLHVERDGQKPIVIGKGATKIKSIGTKAREKMEKLVGHKVFLGLRVKVSPQWSREQVWVERFGYGK